MEAILDFFIFKVGYFSAKFNISHTTLTNVIMYRFVIFISCVMGVLNVCITTMAVHCEIYFSCFFIRIATKSPCNIGIIRR